MRRNTKTATIQKTAATTPESSQAADAHKQRDEGGGHYKLTLCPHHEVVPLERLVYGYLADFHCRP